MDNQLSSGVAIFILLFGLAFAIVMIAAQWKVYEKAGKPGWAAIVPIYNLIVLLEIVERPVWWFVLMLIPVVNLIVAFMVYIELAQRFGKTGGFGIGMIFLPFIFWPILGFGEARYDGIAEPAV